MSGGCLINNTIQYIYVSRQKYFVQGWYTFCKIILLVVFAKDLSVKMIERFSNSNVCLVFFLNRYLNSEFGYKLVFICYVSFSKIGAPNKMSTTLFRFSLNKIFQSTEDLI